MRRFLKCLWLNTRHTVKKQWHLFLALLFLLTVLMYSVEGTMAWAFQYYDYIDHYFDRTEKPYVGFVLSGKYRTLNSQETPALRRELEEACGARPLSVREVFQEDGCSVLAYPPDLLGIVPAMQSGRWLTAQDANDLTCVVSAGLAKQYPIGSTVSCPRYTDDPAAPNGGYETLLTFRVVGILAEGEKPFINHFLTTPFGLDSFVNLKAPDTFIILPYEDPVTPVTMWFQTDTPIETLREQLAPYGTVYTSDELVERYKVGTFGKLFGDSEIQFYLLCMAVLITVSTAVIHFGRSRREYAVMYLLGQSRRMLTATTVTLYCLTVALSATIGHLWLLAEGTPPVSVAQWSVAAVAVLAALCISAVVYFFFRRSPMQLFTENR